MVASNGGKARYTYAQRVLGAYSDLQRSHKKHAVHIASLRKQVKRSADEKGDPLGPQWKNWVGRAVRTLEDQGALTPTTPKGSVTLTPEAKKVIDHTRDRHKFRGETSPKQSDILWREVSQQFSGQGIKRKKHQTATGGDDDSNDEEEVLGTLRGSAHMSPNKKSRKTPKSLARMTKAELQAEARRLQLAMGDFQRVGHGNDHRTSADPTDFKMQLQAREIELEKLASELDEVKNALANEHDKYMSVVRTPIGQTVVSQEAATRTPQDAASLRVRPAGGLTRTVSGSYISNVSKHPTPAPSDGDPGSPGFTGDEMTGGMDISSGVFGRVSPPPGETSAEHQLLDIERIEELTKERDDLRNEMQAKVGRPFL
ncbi:hypothetical protein BD410DRAFT_468339 [Rickenella mellea]|uniref:Uncharacterized protein n=1 Tax=Rickenella mellea TaxID=50990 RepID=A0A4Y7PUK7_9AGAM|nr:hypothetical protein BD410DRAFT_468339 [Rickenella mellea]